MKEFKWWMAPLVIILFPILALWPAFTVLILFFCMITNTKVPNFVNRFWG